MAEAELPARYHVTYEGIRAGPALYLAAADTVRVNGGALELFLLAVVSCHCALKELEDVRPAENFNDDPHYCLRARG
jgi:hypothetical protein